VPEEQRQQRDVARDGEEQEEAGVVFVDEGEDSVGKDDEEDLKLGQT
jgi:hypothetical protein